jgi:hypothetical protein
MTGASAQGADVAIASRRSPFLSSANGSLARRASWHAYTVAFAAACVMIGVYWDISWHMSIGRDTFWTPAHLLIQTGGLIAGISSGYVALKTTFRGTDAEREAAVWFWGFRAPLGAWICIWGCGAMLASAPFDNWWHNAYGLDVKIVSPPHTVLALGIFSIGIGALLLTLARQNRAEGGERTRLARLLAAIGGLFLMNFAIFMTEFSERTLQHGGDFYMTVARVFPFALVALARAIKLRWPATAAAATFMAVMLLLMWIVQLFPATPKLGPIYQHVTHMVAMAFPLWLIAPAIAIDLVMRRFDRRVPPVALALMLGAAFLVPFLAVQWPFASFLVESPLSRNALFNADNYVYWASPTYVAQTHRFTQPVADAWPLAAQLGAAYAFAVVSSALGLAWGRWMTKVQR